METLSHPKKHQHNNTQNMKEPWTNIHMLKEQIAKNSFWSNLWNKIIQEKRWCKETIERIWFQLRDFDPKKAAIRKGLHKIASWLQPKKKWYQNLFYISPVSVMCSSLRNKKLTLFFSPFNQKQVSLRLGFVMTTHRVAAASTIAASHPHRWQSVRNDVSVDVGLDHGGKVGVSKKRRLIKWQVICM